MSNNLSSLPFGSQPGPLSPVQTWTMALAPSEQNYTQIANDPNASLGRAYLWYFVGGLIGGFISYLVSAGVRAVMGPSANPFVSGLGARSVTLQSFLVGLVCVVPIIVVLTTVGITIGAGLSQFLATALGGKGSFTQLLYAYSAAFVPLVIINSLVAGIPCVNLLLVVLGIYGIVLNVVATKAVHQFGWGQAFMASLLVPILLLVLVACLSIGVLALLGPAIGSVFSGITSNI